MFVKNGKFMFRIRLKMAALMLIEYWFDSEFDMICDDDNPKEMTYLIFKCENESVEKLFDMLQALLDKSDQWQMNDESDEEDDLVSWSEEGNSLDETTDLNLKIKIAAQMIVFRRTDEGPQWNSSV